MLARQARTGKTTGIPPRMGFDPSRCAFSLKNSCSCPLASFQEVTVAPKRWTVTDSPVGRAASTKLSRKETVGLGRDGLTPMAEGLLERSMPGSRLGEGEEENSRRGRENGGAADRSGSYLICQRQAGLQLNNLTTTTTSTATTLCTTVASPMLPQRRGIPLHANALDLPNLLLR